MTKRFKLMLANGHGYTLELIHIHSLWTFKIFDGAQCIIDQTSDTLGDEHDVAVEVAQLSLTRQRGSYIARCEPIPCLGVVR